MLNFILTLLPFEDISQSRNKGKLIVSLVTKSRYMVKSNNVKTRCPVVLLEQNEGTTSPPKLKKLNVKSSYLMPKEINLSLLLM